jgi:PEP-CTERM motif
MMKYLAVAISLLVLVAAPASAATNLLANGTFATGDFTGWTVGNSCQTAYNYFSHEDACGVGSAQFWSNHTGAESTLAGAYAISALPLSETVTIDQAGLYEASFSMGANGGINNQIFSSYAIILDGSVVAQQSVTTPSGVMQEFTSDFNIAAPGSHTLEFDFSPYGLISVDSFSLESVGAGGVPEPATWAMFLIGFGATGFVLRRAKRSAVTA